MQDNRRSDRDDEPEVTFELDEAPRSQNRNRIGGIGAAAVAGVGLVSSAAASDFDASIDVFDQLDATNEEPGETPVTSFESLTEASNDPEYPPIDFASSEPLGTDASGAMDDGGLFGATAQVGGGFTLDSEAAQQAFGASTDQLEPVADSLLENDDTDVDLESEIDEADDFDLP